MDCLFCRIANKKTDTKLIYEDKNVSCFFDINPKAPVHILIVPKKHISSINEINSKNVNILGEMFLVAKKLAKKFNISEGYRLVFNIGKKAGQEVDHLHLHLLGGFKK